ncbi:MAG: hypothetical protein GY940_35760, partial [bacterium]|nr:hypothetical protein [bacterium]
MIRIRLNGKIFLFLIIILILYTGQARGQPAPPENNLYNKVMCGYQGWFGAPGDDPYGNLSWKHWCIDGKEPTPLTITIDSWPDYTEYPQDQLFFPAGYNWNYPDGSPAGFFSSNMESTIMLHFKWMRDYGIDGIFLQRFTRSFTDPFYKERREITLNYILKAAAIYGLKVAVMYDVTGTPLTEISQRLTDDWIDLVNQMRIHEHPSYQYHPDHNGQSLPVVAVWGFGFNGTGTKGQAGQVITFFKTHTNPIYRATLMGGVPGYWRFGDRDSKAQYELVYAGFDILSPWTVGRFGDEGGVHWWRNQIMAGDMQLA